jgi:hypothetical protein
MDSNHQTARPDYSLKDKTELEESLSTPSEHAKQAISNLEGDIMVLGAGGKMGPTLCRLLKTS